MPTMTTDPQSTPTKPAFQALDVDLDDDLPSIPPAPRTPGSPTRIGRTMWTRDGDGDEGGGSYSGGGAGGSDAAPMPNAASVITQVTAASSGAPPAYGSRTNAQSFRRQSGGPTPTQSGRANGGGGWLGKLFCCMRPSDERSTRSTQLHVSTFPLKNPDDPPSRPPIPILPRKSNVRRRLKLSWLQLKYIPGADPLAPPKPFPIPNSR